MPGLPRRHHYVTRAYLDGFLEPNAKTLFCYMRRKSEPFAATPANLANIRDFHSVKRADGSIDTTLETRIEREIESPGVPLLRKLASGKTNLDFQQRSRVARLIALQMVRVPYERNFMDQNNIDNLRSYIAEMDSDSERLGLPVNAIEIAITPRDDPRLIRDWIRVTRAQILAEIKEAEEDPRHSSRENLLGLADTLGVIIARMEWTVRYASGSARLITSDRPVVLSFSDGIALGRGLKDLRAEIRFPLSNASVLEIKHRQWLIEAVRKNSPRRGFKPKQKADWTIRSNDADDLFVDSFNQKMASRAHLLVFSGSTQAWLTEWLKAPLKAEKQAVNTLETQDFLSVPGERTPRLTRKRGWFISHE